MSDKAAMHDGIMRNGYELGDRFVAKLAAVMQVMWVWYVKAGRASFGLRTMVEVKRMW